MLGILALNSYQVKELEAACFNKRHTLVCTDWEQKIRVFRRTAHPTRPLVTSRRDQISSHAVAVRWKFDHGVRSVLGTSFYEFSFCFWKQIVY